MVLPTNVRRVALAAALAVSAAAQQLTEGQQLRAQGRYAEAREIFAAVLRDAEKSQPDSRLVALILDDQGINESNLDNFAESERDFTRALSILNRSAADYPATGPVKTHLGELYLLERRPADAEPLLRQAAATLRSVTPPDVMALGVTYNALAVAIAMQGKRPEAETLLRQGLALLETQLGTNHPMLVSSLNPLAGLLIVERRYAEAVAPAERAWQILQSNSPRIAAPDLAGALDILGQVYLHTGRLVEAESCARRAVELAELAYGATNPRLGLYLARYAVVLNRADRKKQAREIQKRADALLANSTRSNSGGYTVNVSALR